MKTISVRVVPKASRVRVKEENGLLKVYLTRPAQDGMANRQLIDVLAGHLGVKRYQLRLVGGQQCRLKTLEVDTP